MCDKAADVKQILHLLKSLYNSTYIPTSLLLNYPPTTASLCILHMHMQYAICNMRKAIPVHGIGSCMVNHRASCSTWSGDNDVSSSDWSPLLLTYHFQLFSHPSMLKASFLFAIARCPLPVGSTKISKVADLSFEDYSSEPAGTPCKKRDQDLMRGRSVFILFEIFPYQRILCLLTECI